MNLVLYVLTVLMQSLGTIGCNENKKIKFQYLIII